MKVIKPLFKDAVVKPAGPKADGDCVYTGGDADSGSNAVPLVLGEALGEDASYLNWLKSQG